MMSAGRSLTLLLAVCLPALGCSKTKPGGPEGADGGATVSPDLIVIDAAHSFRPDFTPNPNDLTVKPGAKTVEIHAIYMSQTGRRLAIVSHQATKRVQVWDLSDEPKKLGDWSRSGTLSPDGRRLVVSDEQGVRSIVDVEQKKSVGKIDWLVRDWHFGSNDLLVVVHCPFSRPVDEKARIRVFDAATAAERISFVVAEKEPTHHSSPFNQGREIAIVYPDRSLIRVWDISAGKVIREMHLSVSKPAFHWSDELHASPDGTLLSAEIGGVGVLFWDGATGEQKAHVLPFGLTARNGAFLPGRAVYLCPSKATRADTKGATTDVVAFDVSTKQYIAVFRGHSASVTALGVSDDGKWLATGDVDGTVKLWDLGRVK
jgi:WD40 repeat protein